MKKLLLLSFALSACYSPQERDCTVSCEAAKDCIGGQVCGADHYCAAPDVAGHCSATDASVISHADARIDARPDAPPQDITLTIAIMGAGTVTVDTVGTCDMPMCMFQVPAGALRTLTATATKPDKPFQMWMSGCSGSVPTCTLTPTADVRVGAKFE